MELAPANQLAELLAAVQQSKRMLAKLTVNIRDRSEVH
jgi:hypothetical protein